MPRQRQICRIHTMNTMNNTRRGHSNVRRNPQVNDFISKRTTQNHQPFTPIVSFREAWDEAVARKGLGNVHFATAQEAIVNHIQAVKDAQQARHSAALNLIGG